jgi:fibro-slime domain-containing protein
MGRTGQRSVGSSLVVLLVILNGPSIAHAAIAYSIVPIVRDFHQTQPDFEIIDFSGTPAAYFANDQTNKIEKGIAGPLGASLGVDGKPVYSSVREPGFYNTVQSAASFAMWFTDIGGATNVRVNNVQIPFTDNGNGTYTYSNTSFFPIDGLGYGNQTNAHNYHFTQQYHNQFTYTPGQFVSIISDDDSWIFVNKKLAVDAGGIHATLGGTANMDTLGLVPGNVYDLDIFYAERNRFDAALILTSNFFLPEPLGAIGLLALAPLGIMRRRRR